MTNPPMGGGTSSSEEVKLNAGDSFTFGTYNGKALEWDVLAVDTKNEKALLITKDCLEKIQFHGVEEAVTWETSDLRAWLGGEFYDTAFTEEQKGKILEVVNTADTNSEYGIDGGNDTTDKVFILSASEMLQYFDDYEDMVVFFEGEEESYWTRTPGSVPTNFVCTNSYGGLFSAGNQVINSDVAVRPAFWLDVSPDEKENP